jgi:transcriptional regulator with XRE-family HTH domain
MAGISNPYLSQIERGLKQPSDAVVEAIARSLKTSADVLYEEAGLTNAEADDARARMQAVLESDPSLSPHQRRVLLDVYDAMVAAGPAPRPRQRGRPSNK